MEYKGSWEENVVKMLGKEEIGGEKIKELEESREENGK